MATARGDQGLHPAEKESCQPPGVHTRLQLRPRHVWGVGFEQLLWNWLGSHLFHFLGSFACTFPHLFINLHPFQV